MMLPELASEVSKRVFHVSDEDVEGLQRRRKGYLKHGTFLYFRTNGKLWEIDLTNISPWGDVNRMLGSFKDAVKGEGKWDDFYKSINLFEMPFVDIADIMGGIDPVSHMPLKGSPGMLSRAVLAARYIWQPQSLPLLDLEVLLKDSSFRDGTGLSLRAGAWTTPQFRVMFDAYNSLEGMERRDLGPILFGWLSGTSPKVVNPEKEVELYCRLKKKEMDDLVGQQVSLEARSQSTGGQKSRSWKEKQTQIDKIGAEIQSAQGYLIRLGIRAKQGPSTFKQGPDVSMNFNQ